MGVPLKFVAAVSPNDIVHRTFVSGDFSLAPEVYTSWSSAIDIQVPYNVERIMLLATGFDKARIKAIMAEFEKNNKVQIPEDILENIRKIITGKIILANEITSQNVYCRHHGGGQRDH